MLNYRFNRFVLSAVLAIGLLFPVSNSFSQAYDMNTLRSTENGFMSIADKAFPAVVNIQVEREIVRSNTQQFPNQMEEFFERFFGNPGPFRNPEFREDQEPESFRQQGGGSGFIISSDGYIVTNHHVIAEQDRITVTLDDRREFDAEVVGSDADTDIALLKIDATELPTLSLADSETIRVGQWAVAVGSPFGLNHSMTTGIVSSTGRFAGITEYDNLIQTDAAINPGNSGGPLLNLDGQVIGINTAIFSRSGGYMGIGFAIPSNTAKAIYTQLRETGTVEKGYIGIYGQDVSQELIEGFDLDAIEGAVITSVVEGSPAQDTGLQVGDVIVSLDGNPVRDFMSFRSQVAMKRPGTTIELGIIRDGDERTVPLTLGDRNDAPEAVGAGEISEPEELEFKEDMGFTIQTLTPDLAEEFQFEDNRGVLVTDVDSDSGAFQRGLRPGMLIVEVNRTTVRNVDEFNQAIEAASGKSSVLMLVKSKWREQIVSRFISIPMNN